MRPTTRTHMYVDVENKGSFKKMSRVVHMGCFHKRKHQWIKAHTRLLKKIRQTGRAHKKSHSETSGVPSPKASTLFDCRAALALTRTSSRTSHVFFFSSFINSCFTHKTTRLWVMVGTTTGSPSATLLAAYLRTLKTPHNSCGRPYNSFISHMGPTLPKNPDLFRDRQLHHHLKICQLGVRHCTDYSCVCKTRIVHMGTKKKYSRTPLRDTLNSRYTHSLKHRVRDTRIVSVPIPIPPYPPLSPRNISYQIGADNGAAVTTPPPPSPKPRNQTPTVTI